MPRRWILAHEPTPDILFVDNTLLGADFLTARLTAMTILWKYVGQLAWPRWLSCDYSYNQIPMASPGAGLAALAAILAFLSLAVWLYRRSPKAFFFGLFFFLALAPMANVFLLIGTIMAERLLYLPSVGFAGCLAAILFAGGPRRATFAATAFLGLATIAFGWRTYQRNLDWSGGERLWLSASEVCPNSFKAVLGPLSGTHTFTTDNIDAAVSRAERGVAIVGGLPPELSLTSPFLTLGTLYRFKGDLSGAADFYHKALDVLQRAVPIDRAVTERSDRISVAVDLACLEDPHGAPADLAAGHELVDVLRGHTASSLSRMRSRMSAAARGSTIAGSPDSDEHSMPISPS